MLPAERNKASFDVERMTNYLGMRWFTHTTSGAFDSDYFHSQTMVRSKQSVVDSS